MTMQQTTPAPSLDKHDVAMLTAEQTEQVAGGVLTVSSLPHICCLSCGSYGRPQFAAVAEAMARI